jgi:hypothetical protein
MFILSPMVPACPGWDSLGVILPLRTFDVDEALEIVRWIQYRNHLAYQSHRKRKAEEMAALSEMSL